MIIHTESRTVDDYNIPITSGSFFEDYSATDNLIAAYAPISSPAGAIVTIFDTNTDNILRIAICEGLYVKGYNEDILNTYASCVIQNHTSTEITMLVLSSQYDDIIPFKKVIFGSELIISSIASNIGTVEFIELVNGIVRVRVNDNDVIKIFKYDGTSLVYEKLAISQTPLPKPAYYSFYKSAHFFGQNNLFYVGYGSVWASNTEPTLTGRVAFKITGSVDKVAIEWIPYSITVCKASLLTSSVLYPCPTVDGYLEYLSPPPGTSCGGLRSLFTIPRNNINVISGTSYNKITLNSEDLWCNAQYAQLYINGIRTPFRKYNPDTGVWERLDNFFGEE